MNVLHSLVMRPFAWERRGIRYLQAKEGVENKCPLTHDVPVPGWPVIYWTTWVKSPFISSGFLCNRKTRPQNYQSWSASITITLWLLWLGYVRQISTESSHTHFSGFLGMLSNSGLYILHLRWAFDTAALVTTVLRPFAGSVCHPLN